MTEDPRCDFFALAPRPQKIIIGLLNIPQIYRLSMKSKRLRRIVKETNRKLDRLEVEFGEDSLSNEVYVKVEKNNEEVLKICIPIAPDSKYHVRRHDVHIIIEHPRNMRSKTPGLDQLSIVGGRLLYMFKFQKRDITISPCKNFLQKMWCPFLQKFETCSRIVIRNTSEPLLERHLNFVLQFFSGEELFTGYVEDNGIIYDNFNFENVTMKKSNWLAEEALQLLNVKQLVIDQRKNQGAPITLLYISAILESWKEGDYPNMRKFRCNLYWDQNDLRQIRNFLLRISCPSRRPAHMSQDDGFHYVIEADICNRNRKYAVFRIHMRFRKNRQYLMFDSYEPVR